MALTESRGLLLPQLANSRCIALCFGHHRGQAPTIAKFHGFTPVVMKNPPRHQRWAPPCSSSGRNNMVGMGGVVRIPLSMRGRKGVALRSVAPWSFKIGFRPTQLGMQMCVGTVDTHARKMHKHSILNPSTYVHRMHAGWLLLSRANFAHLMHPSLSDAAPNSP